ncbi:MAG: DUF1552 domain-containing protein [Phycisphaeraceae bacterium]
MKPNIHTTLDRRHFLRGAAAMIALPSLSAFAADKAVAPLVGAARKDGPRNFVAIGSYLGWHQNAFYPKQAGKNYEIPPTLTPLADYREDFTVFSGMDHRAGNGHHNWSNFLCGRHAGSYSFDQMVADQIGQKTRFASLQLVTGAGENNGKNVMNFSKDGTYLPMTQRPSALYRKMFISKEDKARTEYLLKSGKSSLDNVVDEAKRLSKSLPTDDKDKLDEYFNSVRGLEGKMQRQLNTLNDPVDDPGYKLPDNDPITPGLQLEASVIMYDLIAIALQANQTRVATLFLDGLGQVFTINGRALGSGYHGLSHHGNDPRMINDLVLLDTAHIQGFASFLKQLKEKTTADGKSLLDDTVVMIGTGMGDASRHSNRDLPTLVAGGGFKHQGHVAIKGEGGPLLGDLFITIAQRLGLEMDTFSNASRNINQVFS